MGNLALVTGASSGIGLELARLHAQTGGDLILIARRADKLAAIKLELEDAYSVKVETYAADLTQLGVPRQVFDFVKGQGGEVEVLINNAGIGGHGKFHQRTWSKQESMIDLNIKALCEMTHLFVQDMVKRKHGKILNVASTAGLLPGPLMAVYYATKAFVVSFSQGIAEELRTDGITVTALCPGPVKTEFIAEAELDGVDAFNNAASPVDVARVGYDALQRGKLIVINDWKLALVLNWIRPFLPRWTVLKLSRKLMSKN